MSTESARPNFFILLDLNPNEQWDEKKFVQALHEKLSEWSRQGSSLSAAAQRAQKNREMVPQIRSFMGDPALRAREAEEARKELQSQHYARMTAFERQLALAQAKGYLEPGELARMVKDFADILSEQELRRRLQVPVQQPESPSSEVKALDASTLKTIRDKLQMINKKDLYDLLGMNERRTASSAHLVKAAQDLYNKQNARQPKTAEVTAMTDLAGDAKNIFSSEEKKRAYDESLRQSELDILLKELDENIGRTTEKRLHPRQIQMFLEASMRAGWQTEAAFTQLRQHARDRKWILTEIPDTADLAWQQVCGRCHTLNEKERNYCRKCNAELRIICPNCGQPVPTLAVSCGACGFLVGDRYIVDALLDECHIALEQGALEQAQQLLRQAEEAWKPGRADARTQRIREYKQRIRAMIETQQRQAGQFYSYMKDKQFFAAQAFLHDHPTASADHARDQQAINAGIEKARNIFRTVRTPGLSRDRKAEICRRALQVCKDFKEARELLSTMPPEPPRHVQARAEGTAVALNWEPSRTPGIKYKLVRRSGSTPSSVQDGTLVATVSGEAYLDSSPEYGAPLYYAVFADDDGVISPQGATHREPVMILQPVSSIKVEIIGDLLKLSWQLPPNAHAVRVIRKEGAAPTSRSDGVRIATQGLTSLLDRGALNGSVYFYSIYCVYKGPDGSDRFSPPKVVCSTARGLTG